ncbi:hypothetical protein PM082_010264 [Marasmius tenuissimus]|nr:hypothetical protein PM082_010264 [Marasmius tenuissimus]
MSSLLRRAHISVRNVCKNRGYATSTPKSPVTENTADPSQKIGPAAAIIPKSACLADTVLPGLSYLKGQEPVLAKPDEWYPEWLWTLLEPKKIDNDGPSGKGRWLNRPKYR